MLPRIEDGERGTCASAEVLEKQTKPPGRYTEASLLGAMETAGKSIDDEELREAMKEAGLGTPATRAETIERLLKVGYILRDGKALVSTTKGKRTIELLGTHPLTSAELTGSWEKRLSEIEHGQGDRKAFMADIDSFTVPDRGLLPRAADDADRRLSQRRRRRDREPLRLRLHLLQEQERARLRVHHLEEPGRVPHHPRGRPRPARAGRGGARIGNARQARSRRRQRGRDRGRGRQAPDLIRHTRPLPQRRRRDPREPGRVRLHLLEVEGRAGLRIHHLEEPGRLHDHPRRGPATAGDGRGGPARLRPAGKARSAWKATSLPSSARTASR